MKEIIRKDIPIMSIYIPNKKESKYSNQLKEWQRETDNPATVTAETD